VCWTSPEPTRADSTTVRRIGSRPSRHRAMSDTPTSPGRRSAARARVAGAALSAIRSPRPVRPGSDSLATPGAAGFDSLATPGAAGGRFAGLARCGRGPIRWPRPVRPGSIRSPRPVRPGADSLASPGAAGGRFAGLARCGRVRFARHARCGRGPIRWPRPLWPGADSLAPPGAAGVRLAAAGNAAPEPCSWCQRTPPGGTRGSVGALGRGGALEQEAPNRGPPRSRRRELRLQ